MQINFFFIIFILVIILIAFVVFGLNKSRSSQSIQINGGMVAGIMGVLVFVGLIFFFLFGISSSSNSGSGTDFSFAPFIPIFVVGWIPIMIAINANKKKSLEVASKTNSHTKLESQQDEIKNIQFCSNCGGQYHTGDQYCEMCGSRL